MEGRAREGREREGRVQEGRAGEGAGRERGREGRERQKGSEGIGEEERGKDRDRPSTIFGLKVALVVTDYSFKRHLKTELLRAVLCRTILWHFLTFVTMRASCGAV